MAKGYRITDEIRARVNHLHRENREWKPPKIRERVRGDLYLEVKKKPDLLPKLARGWPSVESVRGIMKIADDVESTDEFKEKEKPWCMGTPSESPISPDAMLAVLKVWKLSLARGKWLTVREAKWAALLSKLAKDTEQLSIQASEYARLERLYDLVRQPFDSTILDMFYMKIPLAILGGIEEDKEKQNFMFVPEIVSEGLEDEVFKQVKGGRFLSISASKEDMEFYVAEMEKRDKEWEAYKKEARNEG